MSAAARLISGSLASWAQIAVNMVAQLLLVPLYLNYWDVKMYGIWLAIVGIMNALSMLDMGHQSFMAFEFLRIGRNDIPTLSKSLSSAVVIGVAISFFQMLLIGVIFLTGILTFLLGEAGTTDFGLINTAALALIVQGTSWLINTTVPAYLTRALAPFGYYPRFMWWGLAFTIVGAVTPLVAVIMGADILIASAAMGVAILAQNVPFYIDLFKIFKKEHIRPSKPSLALGLSNFRMSLPLLGKSLLENVRQQGVRLLLAPLSGAVGLAAFATMRTGANVALQGLNTICNPILPDLMRFLHDRDQPRSEAAFATIWIVVVALMAPAVVILQTFVEPLYVVWTQGKIPFNPLLFSILSLGVLVYAVVQPAMAIVVGNNLTKTQLMLTGIAGAVLLGVLFLLVPFIGILGAAIALLVAELVAGIGYQIYAERWLNENDLIWPRRPFYLAITSVCISAAGVILHRLGSSA